MNLDDFIKKHERMVHKMVNWARERYSLSDSDCEEYRQNAFGDVVMQCKGKKYEKLDSSYVRLIVMSSIVDTFYKLQILMEKRTKGEQTVANTRHFSELQRNGSNIEDFYQQRGDYKDRGGCGCFTENPVFGPFPGFEDLNSVDSAVIDEYCNLNVLDQTRRSYLRRQVDQILLKLGIDSSNVHEYTSRIRRRPSD